MFLQIIQNSLKKHLPYSFSPAGGIDGKQCEFSRIRSVSYTHLIIRKIVLTTLSVNDIVTVSNVKKIITVKMSERRAELNSDFCVAVHGLVYLKHKNDMVPSEELAKNICTNPARVRKVMALSLIHI